MQDLRHKRSYYRGVWFGDSSSNMATPMKGVRENLLLIFFVHISLFTKFVQGYYCEWNLCEGDHQYCCGDNQCCNNVYSSWYFWAGIIFLVLMLLSCGGFFRYCYRPQIIVHQVTNFIPLLSDQTHSEELVGLVAYSDLETQVNHPIEIKVSKSRTFSAST